MNRVAARATKTGEIDIFRIAYALALAGAVVASPAAAVVVNYTTTGAGAFTLFPGTVQQTTITLVGCSTSSFYCNLSPDLAAGVPQDLNSYYLELTSIGVNDGSFPGPDTTFDAPVTFTFGSQSVALTQQIRLRQIANNQFFVQFTNSSPATIDLAGIGSLQLELLSGGFQYRGGTGGGGGSIMRTRFTLLSEAPAVPEPASWAMMIAGFGLAGAALRCRTHGPAILAA